MRRGPTAIGVLVLALLLAWTTVAAGVAAGCTMKLHCGGCPEGALAWRAPVECPLILPASPRQADAERVPAPEPAAIVSPIATLAAPAPVPARTNPGAAPVPVTPRPPGLAVLRI